MATAVRDAAEDRARSGFGFWRKARPNPGTVCRLNAPVPVPIFSSGPCRRVTEGIAGFRDDRVLARWLVFQSNAARVCRLHSTVLTNWFSQKAPTTAIGIAGPTQTCD
jgi:hypothetical protein